MVMNILMFLLVSAIGGMIICFFFMFRNNYTFNCAKVASDCIGRYAQELLEKGEYNTNINYYHRFEYDYDKHMYNLGLWGRYSYIKPEYREMLKKYDRR